MMLAVVLGGCWALLSEQSPWSGSLPGWLSTLQSWTASLERPVPPAGVAETARIEQAPKPAPLEASPLSQSMTTAAQPATSAVTTGVATPPVELAHKEAALPPTNSQVEELPERLQPPVADPADPNQSRAVAVGLHPDLSSVLLARLSRTDYRNAAIAIKTALAETADGDVYVWPRQRTVELAIFEVRFVPGAPAECRRYVVTVAKDGWMTTALPMEKCGVGTVGSGKVPAPVDPR